MRERSAQLSRRCWAALRINRSASLLPAPQRPRGPKFPVMAMAEQGCCQRICSVLPVTIAVEIGGVV